MNILHSFGWALLAFFFAFIFMAVISSFPFFPFPRSDKDDDDSFKVILYFSFWAALAVFLITL